MWKIDNGVLSYLELDPANEAKPKPVSFRVKRPKFWLRWAVCAPKMLVDGQRDGGRWVWLSDDRRDARLFIMLSGSDHYTLSAIAMPGNLVAPEYP